MICSPCSSRWKSSLALPTFAFALLCSHAAFAPAQAPAGAPADSNGLCNDGTYSTAPVKSGACGGHKGVKTWFAPAAAAKPATAAAVTPPKAASPAIVAAAPAPKPAPAQTTALNIGSQTQGAGAGKSVAAPAATAAAGGGPGMVWVNTSTKVYHCPTDRYYGKTKAGSYMTESAAAANGNKPDAGKKCF